MTGYCPAVATKRASVQALQSGIMAIVPSLQPNVIVPLFLSPPRTTGTALGSPGAPLPALGHIRA